MTQSISGEEIGLGAGIDHSHEGETYAAVLILIVLQSTFFVRLS
jgi:hypothetical protein